jgi:hypothetical protein
MFLLSNGLRIAALPEAAGQIEEALAPTPAAHHDACQDAAHQSPRSEKAASQGLDVLPSAREDVASLTQGVLKAMLLMKVKAAALVLAVIGLAISGGLLTHRVLASQRSPEASTADAAPRELKVLDRLAGKWRYEWVSQPTEGEPKGSKGSGTSTKAKSLVFVRKARVRQCLRRAKT